MSFAYSQVNYNPESETLNVNLHKFKYCPDQLTKNGVIVKSVVFEAKIKLQCVG